MHAPSWRRTRCGLARPGGNVTGFTNAEDSLTGKSPAMNRVGFIFDPKVALGGGARLGHRPTCQQNHQFVRSISLASCTGMVLPDVEIYLHCARIIALANQHRLPAIYPHRNFAQEGGLMSYGVDIRDRFRRAANYGDRILKGTKPTDLPSSAPREVRACDQSEDRQGAGT